MSRFTFATRTFPLVVLLPILTVSAQIPDSISFQGHLIGPSGAVVDTTVPMTFKLYKGAVEVWTNTIPAVVVDSGGFNVVLGGNGLGNVAFNQPMKLGITVGGDAEIVPRTPLASSVYALGMRGMYAVRVTDGFTEAVNVVGGSSDNYVAPSVLGATIGGGGGWAISTPVTDSVLANWGTVSGGMLNTAAGWYSTVGGGDDNKARGTHSAVGGGEENKATGDWSSIGGGNVNFATGSRSAVAGGSGNQADGVGSTVGGGASNLAGGTFATVSGGAVNVAGGSNSTVGGGLNNSAIGQNATVSGGTENVASDTSSTIAGGSGNSTEETATTIGGGRYNYATAVASTIAGGQNNTAHGEYSTIGGGHDNVVGDETNQREDATVGGGHGNEARHNASTVAGGASNVASETLSAILGGALNTASGWGSVVGGGYQNNASGNRSVVLGGVDNTASGEFSTVAGGNWNAAGGYSSFAAGFGARALHDGSFVWRDRSITTFDDSLVSTGPNQFLIQATGGVGIGTASPSSQLTVHGNLEIDSLGAALIFPDGSSQTTAASGSGSTWGLTGNSGTTPGTHFLGTTDSTSFEIRVNDERVMRVDTESNFIAGHSTNNILNEASFATIGGGGGNVVDGSATVAGGLGNWAGFEAAIGGGNGNTAGFNATIGGGAENIASGDHATIPGGFQNAARGAYSFAAGYRAAAEHRGAFVWNDGSVTSYDDSLASTADNQFLARASGGFFLYTGAAPNLTTGISLPAGSGTWGSLSSRASKTAFEDVDTGDYLDRVASLELKEWSYKTEDGVSHVGPMAEDFYEAFGHGPSEKSISAVDADGVALAAIQGLHQLVKQQQADMNRMQSEIDRLRSAMARAGIE